MRKHRSPRALQTLLLACCVALARCATRNPYDRSAGIEARRQWHTPLPHEGSSDALTDWWDRFDDPVLSRLIATADERSPSLVQAWAAFARPRAALVSTGSGADFLRGRTTSWVCCDGQAERTALQIAGAA